VVAPAPDHRAFACAVWEFSPRWPEAADDMAAVVCGRWLHSTLASDDPAASSATPNVANTPRRPDRAPDWANWLETAG